MHAPRFPQMDGVVVSGRMWNTGGRRAFHRLRSACRYFVWPTQYFQKYLDSVTVFKNQEIAHKNTDFRLALENLSIWPPWAPRSVRGDQESASRLAPCRDHFLQASACLALSPAAPGLLEMDGVATVTHRHAVLLFPSYWLTSRRRGFCLDL